MLDGMEFNVRSDLDRHVAALDLGSRLISTLTYACWGSKGNIFGICYCWRMFDEFSTSGIPGRSLGWGDPDSCSPVTTASLCESRHLPPLERHVAACRTTLVADYRVAGALPATAYLSVTLPPLPTWPPPESSRGIFFFSNAMRALPTYASIST